MASLTKHFVAGLAHVPEVQLLSPRVVAALGMNPGRMTLTGTNTYLVGTGRKRVLIDTGEGLPAYLPVLERAMEAAGCSGLQELVITHHHRDHVGGIGQVLQRFGPVPVRRFPMPLSAPEDPEAKAGIVHGDSHDFEALADGDVVRTEGATLRVLHTPGHTEDHVALLLVEENSVFSGDCVLGAGTTVFSNLGAYMRSLRLLQDLCPARIYPGHGPVVEDAGATIAQYISHRQQRVDQVVEQLRRREWQTVREITAAIYTEVPAELLPAAAANVLVVLSMLNEEGRALMRAPAGDDGERWCAADAPAGGSL